MLPPIITLAFRRLREGDSFAQSQDGRCRHVSGVEADGGGSVDLRRDADAVAVT